MRDRTLKGVSIHGHSDKQNCAGIADGSLVVLSALTAVVIGGAIPALPKSPLTSAPGRIRTCVVRIRSPLPHPLGHGGWFYSLSFGSHSDTHCVAA